MARQFLESMIKVAQQCLNFELLPVSRRNTEEILPSRQHSLPLETLPRILLCRQCPVFFGGRGITQTGMGRFTEHVGIFFLAHRRFSSFFFLAC